MNSVFEDFKTRSDEINGYFDFVVGLARKDILLQAAAESTPPQGAMADDGLLKTLKASCYLLLYNLVESTMRNSIEAIFDELRATETGFDSCRDELKKEVLKNFRKRKANSILGRINSIASDVIHETFVARKAFSGNLDAKEIRKTAKRYGFDQPEGSAFSLLLTVKNIRNDLAHGVKSFSEVGRGASPNDLEQAKKQTFDILEKTILSIRIYLEKRSYLSPEYRLDAPKPE